jgi:hypothetical protein
VAPGAPGDMSDAQTSTSKSSSRLRYFHLLTQAEQRASIRRLADLRMSDQTIASLTGMDVEAVRSILANPQGST